MIYLSAFVTFLLSCFVSPHREIYKVHDFKLSVCEIVWSPDQEHFEVKFYIFHDDLREAIYGKPDYPKLDPTDISTYLLKRFEISLSAQPVKLEFSSFREKNDQVLHQFNSPKIRLTPNSKILVKNTLLLEKFRDQINMVYVIFPDKPKQTQMMNAVKSEVSFNF